MTIRTPIVVFFNYLLDTLLVLTSLFLICLILIQRGKGGGLAGAFGGAGGSSAFGTKAGDVFTRITMITAGIWISLSMLLVVLSNQRTSAFIPASGSETKSPFSPAKDGAGKVEGGADKKASLDPAPANVPAPASATPAAPAAPISSGSPSAPIPVDPLPTTPAPK